MAGINIMGSYSGIDQSAIDGLMKVEKLPLEALASNKTDITEKQNAWKDINTRLNSLFERLKDLQNKDTHTSKKSTSSNEDVVSMTANRNSVTGSYKIEVTELATSTNLVGGKVGEEIEDFKIDTALNIEGSFSIKNADTGEKAGALTIDVQKTDSLKSIVDKVNEGSKETGISASIIDNRIVFNDSKTGAREITLDGDALSGLKLAGKDSEGKDNLIVNSGTQANFTINGISVKRDSNTITDVVENLTINLKNTHAEGESETLIVSLDTSKTEKAVKAFVDQYNSTMTFIEDKMSAGTPDVPATRGVLAGDNTLKRLHSSLRNMVTSQISNAEKTSIKDISQLGVTTIDRFGQLTFDASKLKEELAKDPTNVQNFFSSKDSNNNEIGFSSKLGDYVDSIISKTNGVIKGKNDSFERGLKDISRQIERVNMRIERKEAYYTKMFSALDVAMMKAESQMEWLVSQVSSMNAQSGSGRR